MKTMSEINHQKWSRMKKIIENLKEKPMGFSEILQLFPKSPKEKITERTVQNYLAELVALGLVYYNKETGLYEWIENKVVFKNKAEYEIALKHSKKLFEEMTPDIEDQPFENPESVVDLLISKPTKYAYLLKHLRTGYNDFWAAFQAYYGLMEKYDFPHVTGGISRKSGKLQFELLEHNPDIPTNITQAVFYKDTVFIPNENEKRDWFLHDSHSKALNDPKIEKDFRELIRLKTKLVKEILFIMCQVQHGTPLQGYCDICPHLKVTINSNT